MKLEGIVGRQVLLYVMMALFVMGVLTKIISHFAVRSLARAAGNIHKSNHRLMKLVKAKFEHASMISDRVQNVEAFVDKYLYEYRVLGIRIGNWSILYRKILWAVAALGLVWIFGSYQAKGLETATLQAAEITVGIIMVLLLFAYGTGDGLKLEAAKNYMVEYLENVCVHRYLKAGRGISGEESITETNRTAEGNLSAEATKLVGSSVLTKGILSEETNEDYISTASAEVVAGVDCDHKEEDFEEKSDENEQEMRIRAILQEFLA